MINIQCFFFRFAQEVFHHNAEESADNSKYFQYINIYFSNMCVLYEINNILMIFKNTIFFSLLFLCLYLSIEDNAATPFSL